ncbi:unnamed protein product [Phytophthora fragariaefolia]|uniref:Unnamed protein product n=1 Tax=Phytophthora fragariaefolia TaxID=1490495 RepID=A0A9W6XMV9_9STRA|nr:unnamed protein product [Phytophthora fragariaefolia]
MRRATQGHAPDGQTWSPNGGDLDRGPVAWLEHIKERDDRTQSGWARQDQAIGSKRIPVRAFSSQEGDRQTMSAKMEREDNEAEPELLAALSYEAWAQTEQDFPQTNMQMCFLMNETSFFSEVH